MPSISLAEAPQTFNNITFGQPPEAEMICIKGPCSTKQLRPDIEQNKIGMGQYIRSVDITTYGGWEVTPPTYSFYKDKFVRVSFNLLCEHDNSQRCIDETLEKLRQDYDLELQNDASMEVSEALAIQNRTYRVGEDMVVKISYQKINDYWRLPSVTIENIPLMESMRSDVRSSHK